MLGARSMAVVGASPRADSFGARMVLEAQRGSARVHLVNPRYDRIGELPCAPSLADLDEPVDLVLLGVPDAALVEQLEAAAAIGCTVGGAVRVRARAAREGRGDGDRRRHGAVRGGLHGVRQQRARCAGAGLPGAGSVAGRGNQPRHPLRVGVLDAVARRRGFGFRLAVSSGQELVTDTADYVDYALDDPETGIIALLMETPRSVPRLRQALLRAAEQGVPVVILTVGGSPRGRAMVAAHSGALAGEHAAWQAFCAATGAVHVSDLAEFTDTLELFSAGAARHAAAASRRCTTRAPNAR